MKFNFTEEMINCSGMASSIFNEPTLMTSLHFQILFLIQHQQVPEVFSGEPPIDRLHMADLPRWSPKLVPR